MPSLQEILSSGIWSRITQGVKTAFRIYPGTGSASQTTRYISDDGTYTTISAGISVIGGQIAFPAVQVPSAGANVLDDYEESQAYQPALTFGGGSTGLTYTNQSGTYTKIGDRISVDGLITVNSNGSSTGQATISLPFAVTSYAAIILRIDTITFGGRIQGFASAGTSAFLLEQVTEAGVRSAITEANIPDGAEIMFSAVYR